MSLSNLDSVTFLKRFNKGSLTLITAIHNKLVFDLSSPDLEFNLAHVEQLLLAAKKEKNRYN